MADKIKNMKTANIFLRNVAKPKYVEKAVANKAYIHEGIKNFFLRRPPQQKLRTHNSLKAYFATLVTKMISFFHFSK
jgi:hypothetical protein